MGPGPHLRRATVNAKQRRQGPAPTLSPSTTATNALGMQVRLVRVLVGTVRVGQAGLLSHQTTRRTTTTTNTSHSPWRWPLDPLLSLLSQTLTLSLMAAAATTTFRC